MEGHAVREVRAHVLHPEPVDQELATARRPAASVLAELVAQHARAGRRRADHRLGAVEHAREAPRQRRALARVARVHVHLAAAGLLEREVDLAAEPLEQPHDRAPRLWEERVVEAGDEEGNAHAGYRFRFPRGRIGQTTRETARRGERRVYTQDFDPVSRLARAELDLRRAADAWRCSCCSAGCGWRRSGRRWSRSGVAMLVAMIVYGMPVDQTALSATRGRRVRPVPDHVDRRHGDLDLQHDRRDRALRGAAPLVRRDLDRPARPGRDHRLLLRRAARGARRLRHAGGDHRGDADRARLQADQGGRAWRSSPTPRRSPSARSRSRSSRSPRSPACPRRTSARWSAARRRSWR